MNDKQIQAGNNLVYYMRMIAKKAGVGWDYDNEAEIREIVNLIVEAAAEEAAKKVLRALPSSIQE